MISIITPTHNPKYLEEVYYHLKAQTYEDWEWILVLNGGLTDLGIYFKDDRVKTFQYEGKNEGYVGALKKFACMKASGEYILELDHDDFLLPTALEKAVEAFEIDKNIVFVHSDDVGVRPDMTTLNWGAQFGWTKNYIEYKGQTLSYNPSPDPIPQNISKIWFAPDHFRAWRKDAYDKIGGHNEDLPVADDHELICRLYLEGDFYHINECLYIYNVHGENTWLKNIDDIQRRMWDNHYKFLEPMMMKWSKKNGLDCLDLCGAIDCPPGYKSVDRQNADIVCNLNDPWPIEDNSVGLLRANDAIEHLKNPIHTMNEAYRVLAHGGVFLINVPSTDGKGAWCDPTHISFWNDRSFRYYTEAVMRKYLEPECTCKFMVCGIRNVIKYDNIPFVEARLIAVKDGKRIMGEVKW